MSLKEENYIIKVNGLPLKTFFFWPNLPLKTVKREIIFFLFLRFWETRCGQHYYYSVQKEGFLHFVEFELKYRDLIPTCWSSQCLEYISWGFLQLTAKQAETARRRIGGKLCRNKAYPLLANLYWPLSLIFSPVSWFRGSIQGLTSLMYLSLLSFFLVSSLVFQHTHSLILELSIVGSISSM